MNEETKRETAHHKRWESGQLVVALSRTKMSEQIIIVSEMKIRKDVVVILYNGAPGAGKTFILQTVGLYAMCVGLRVMSTALMAARAHTLGAITLHQLFRGDRRRNGIIQWMAKMEHTGFLCDECQSRGSHSHVHVLLGLSRVAVDNDEAGVNGRAD